MVDIVKLIKEKLIYILIGVLIIFLGQLAINSYNTISQPTSFIQIFIYHENILPTVYTIVVKNVGNASTNFLSFDLNTDTTTKIISNSSSGDIGFKYPLATGIGSFMQVDAQNIAPNSQGTIRIQLNMLSNLTVNIGKIDGKYCISPIQINFGPILNASSKPQNVTFPSGVTQYSQINFINEGPCSLPANSLVPVELT